MANQEHVDIVKAGVAAIREWREAKPETRFDLAAADLSGADLSSANLSSADLSGADLYGAILGDANLSDANLRDANLYEADLSRADLRRADLSDAHLYAADLRGADLSRSDLRGADLYGADLSGADLSRSGLNAANLSGTFLEGVDLTETNLTEAKLYGIRSGEAAGFAKLLNRIWPTKLWFLLDSSHVRGTRFDAKSQDPYSILRRTYTGPQLTFVFFFSVVALLPMIGLTFFWSAVSKTEGRIIPFAVHSIQRAGELAEKTDVVELNAWAGSVSQTVSALEQSPLISNEDWRGQVRKLSGVVQVIQTGLQLFSDLRQDAIEDAQLLDTLDEAAAHAKQAEMMLSAIAPDGKLAVEERRVWELVLGIKDGWAQTILTVVLVLYNLTRAFLTYQMSSLRDHEERTGDSPALKQYWWLFNVHRVANLALLVSIVAAVWRIGQMLSHVVVVPV